MRIRIKKWNVGFSLDGVWFFKWKDDKYYGAGHIPKNMYKGFIFKFKNK